MAEIINLRQARKRKARTDKEQTSAENRAVFGQTKATKSLDKAQKALTEKKLDEHQRDN